MYTHGFIGKKTKKRLNKLYTECMTKAEMTGEFQSCHLLTKVLEAGGSPNEYNTRIFESYDSLIGKTSAVYQFYNHPQVRDMLHVDTDAEWNVCSDTVSHAMKHDFPKTSVPQLQFLAEKVRVLLYSGIDDVNCNFMGTEAVLSNHLWLHRDWSEASRGLWKVDHDGHVAGQFQYIYPLLGASQQVVKSETQSNIQGKRKLVEGFPYPLSPQIGLGFLLVYNSGHLVPYDQPQAALDIVTRFISDNPYYDDVKLSSDADCADEEDIEDDDDDGAVD